MPEAAKICSKRAFSDAEPRIGSSSGLLRCRPVPSRPGRTPARLLLVLGGVALAFSLAASGGADSAPALLQRAHALRAERTALSARSHAALLRLYALDSELARARARLDRLTERAAQVRRERVLTAKRLRIATGDVHTAQVELAARLRQLYEQGDTDPLAILLGARSLDEALAGIDRLNRSAPLAPELLPET